jgi:hypothetical protein
MTISYIGRYGYDTVLEAGYWRKWTMAVKKDRIMRYRRIGRNGIRNSQ